MLGQHFRIERDGHVFTPQWRNAFYKECQLATSSGRTTKKH